MFTSIMHKILYKFGYFVAFVKDIPRLVERNYYIIKYGGADKIPKEILEKHLKHHVNQMLFAPDSRF